MLPNNPFQALVATLLIAVVWPQEETALALSDTAESMAAQLGPGALEAAMEAAQDILEGQS